MRFIVPLLIRRGNKILVKSQVPAYDRRGQHGQIEHVSAYTNSVQAAPHIADVLKRRHANAITYKEARAELSRHGLNDDESKHWMQRLSSEGADVFRSNEEIEAERRKATEASQRQRERERSVFDRYKKMHPDDETISASDPSGDPYFGSHGEEWIKMGRDKRQQVIDDDQYEHDEQEREEREREEQQEEEHRQWAAHRDKTAAAAKEVQAALHWRKSSKKYGLEGLRQAAGGSYYGHTHSGVSIRVSDHRQKPGGGFNEGTQERMGEDDIDVVIPADGRPEVYVEGKQVPPLSTLKETVRSAVAQFHGREGNVFRKAIIPVIRYSGPPLFKSLGSQLSFETVKPHSRTHLRTIPVQGYQRTRRIPAKRQADATSSPLTNTEQAVALAQQLDPANIGPLLGAFQRAHKAGYFGRAAQNAASQIYWGMREGPLPDNLKDLHGFIAATAEIEQLMRPAESPYPEFNEDLYRTHLQTLSNDAKLKMLRDAGYTGKYLHPFVLEDALVRLWRKEQMKKSITHVYVPGIGLLKTHKLSKGQLSMFADVQVHGHTRTSPSGQPITVMPYHERHKVAPPEAPALARPVSVQLPQPKEQFHAQDEPAKPETSGLREPERRGASSGVHPETVGGPGDRPAVLRTPRIVTIRSEHTGQGDPALVPELCRQHLNAEQQRGVSLAINAMTKWGGFLCADGTGTGKTRTELSVAKHFIDVGKKVLIVSPAEVIKPNWKKGTMSGSFSDDSATMGIPIVLTNGEAPLAVGAVNLTTYHALGKIKDKIDKDTVLILDEAHALKNKTSARAKHAADMMDESGPVMYATATPADKPLHIAYLVRANVFGNRSLKETYTKLGLELYDQHVGGGEMRKVWRVAPSIGIDECVRRMEGLFDQMTKDGLMIKRELSMDRVDVGMERIELTPEQKAELAAVFADKMKEYKGNKAIALIAARLHQEPIKIPHVVEMVKQSLAAGRHPIVFCGRVNDITSDDDDESEGEIVESVGTVAALKAALIEAGVPESIIGELHGGATKTPDQKKKAMQNYQTNKTKVMIATIQSGGTGINLDDTVGDSPRDLIVMTPPFTANDMSQALGRVNRLNTKSDVRVRGVLCDTPIDDWNAGVLEHKFHTLGAVVGGNARRGLETVRPADAPDSEDAVREPFAWGESLHPVPKVYYNTPYHHNELIGQFGGRRIKRGEDWTTVFPSQEHFDRYTAHVAPKVTPAKVAAAVTSAASPKPPAPPMSPERKAAIHQALKQLHADNPDRTTERNNVGYNSMDADFGGSLADAPLLTDAQAHAAAKMLGKYKRQLGDALHAKVTTDEGLAHAPTPTAVPTASPTIATRKVSTARGERHVHSFSPGESFWRVWKGGNRPSYLSAGKNPRTGSWEGSIWGETAEEVAKHHAHLQSLMGLRKSIIYVARRRYVA